MSGTQFFFSKPQCENKFISVADVQDKLTAFNLMFEIGPNGSSTNCPDPNFAAQWRKAIREGVINCAGKPMELDFFESVAGGVTTDVDATDLYIKSNCDVDYNIFAETTATGGSPGAATWFTIARSLHSGTGKYSNIAEGGSIYLYEDDQELLVRQVDRTTDYAHRALVVPHNKDYVVNVPAGKKMLFSPVRIVGPSSAPVDSSTWLSNGYIAKVQPLRVRKDYKFPIALDRAYHEVLQFAVIFDHEGKEVDSWEWKEKISMREELKWRKNVSAFNGQKVSNPLLLGAEVDANYPGYDGYLRKVRYGGGVVWDYGKSKGFSLNSDFTPIMIRQDAYKKSDEFIVLHGMPFLLQMVNRNNIDFGNAPGSMTFDSFKRSGATAEDIRKLAIKSYQYGNYSLHFKQMSALSDTRGIGNHNFPYMGMMMPGTGLKDSLGRDVPPIEFFRPKGNSYEEYENDMRRITRLENIEGYAVDLTMMAVHCPNNHIILNPADY